MISKKIEESGSIKNSNGMIKIPELIHEKTFTTFSFTSEFCSWINTRTETTKEHKMLRDAIVPLNPLLTFLPNNPLNMNPNKGNNGIKAASFIIKSYLFVSRLYI